MFEAGKDQLLQWKLVGYLAIICHDWRAPTCSYQAVTEVIGYTIVWHVERRALSLSLSLSPSYFKLLFGTISQTVVWSNLISLQLAAAGGKNTRIICAASPTPSPPCPGLQKIVTSQRKTNEPHSKSSNNSQSIVLKVCRIQLLNQQTLADVELSHVMVKFQPASEVNKKTS